MQATFILCAICNNFPLGQQRCYEAGLLDTLVAHLVDLMASQVAMDPLRQGVTPLQQVQAGHYHLLLTCTLLALGTLWDDQPAIVARAIQDFDIITHLAVRSLCP